MKTVGFGKEDCISDVAYQISFGNLPNGTVYNHYLPVPANSELAAKNIDLARNKGFEKKKSETGWEIKALQVDSQTFQVTTQYTTTSGYMPTLVPVYLDPELMDVARKDFPLYAGLIKKVTNKGLYAEYNKLTTRSTADWMGELAALTESDDTYTRATTKMRFAYAVGRISGPMLAASVAWKDALQLEVYNKRYALAQLVETAIIQGNNSSDSDQFSGFSTLVTTNTQDMSAAKITIQQLRDSIRVCRQANGHPGLIVTDYKTLDDIKALVQDSLRYAAPLQTIAFGIQSIEFEGIPVVPDLSMPTTASSRELHVWDTDVAELRILQDETFEELAKTSDAYKFMLKWYGALIIKAENFCYRVYGLA